MINKFAVIGNPIAQSRSPEIHKLFGKQLGDDIEYTAILATDGTFTNTVNSFFAAAGRGMNVTAPFKLAAANLCDQLSERATIAQAVNTLIFKDQQIIGDNTDGIGLVSDIQNNLGFSLGGKNILIIGAGGASRGIILPLLQAIDNGTVTVINRTAAKALDLAQAVSHVGEVNAGGYATVSGMDFDLVINATSAGLQQQVMPVIDYGFTEQALAYDLSYASHPSEFMCMAQDKGAVLTSDGLGMLVEQAAFSYELWLGKKPSTAAVIPVIRNSLSGV